MNESPAVAVLLPVSLEVTSPVEALRLTLIIPPPTEVIVNQPRGTYRIDVLNGFDSPAEDIRLPVFGKPAPIAPPG